MVVSKLLLLNGFRKHPQQSQWQNEWVQVGSFTANAPRSAKVEFLKPHNFKGPLRQQYCHDHSHIQYLDGKRGSGAHAFNSWKQHGDSNWRQHWLTERCWDLGLKKSSDLNKEWMGNFRGYQLLLLCYNRYAILKFISYKQLSLLVFGAMKVIFTACLREREYLPVCSPVVKKINKNIFVVAQKMMTKALLPLADDFATGKDIIHT